MARQAVIILRVHEDQKKRLEKAAGATGLTLSSFLLKAADRHAKEVEKKTASQASSKKLPTTHASGALPNFFKMTCVEASRGGDRGYGWAGQTLLGAAANLIEWQSTAELQDKFQELKAAINQGNDIEILGWFDRELPRCMALIPTRRRCTFLEGIYKAVEESGEDILIP